MRVSEIKTHVSKTCKDIRLFYPNNDGHLVIEESENNNNKTDLRKVNISNLPNCWIFEHEFYQLPTSQNILQRGSFSNMGNRVEKSIIWQEGELLYILMIEMKSEIVPNKIASYIDKFEHSLNALATHLAVHSHLSEMSTLEIFPVAILLYNTDNQCKNDYFSDKSPRLLDSSSVKIFKEKYIEEGKRNFKIGIFPNALQMDNRPTPILFLKNPTNNLGAFNLDFEEIRMQISEYI